MELKNEMWRLRWVRFSLLFVAAGLLQGACWAANWFPLGPFGGNVRSLAADPADPSHHLFLGTATGWVYDSHDGGVKWTRISQINGRNDLAVDHILVDKRNPKRLIVGAWVIGKATDGGIFISEDYGKNWYSQAEMRGQSVRSLARSESDPRTLVAGTLSGVFRSTDNGVHWMQISPRGSTEIHEVESVAIDPVDPGVIYVGTWHLPWKTTDGGASWHNIKQGIIDDSDVFSIIVDPKDPKTVYASACSGIYKSSDSGDLFHKVQGIPSTARRTRKLAQDPEQLDTVFAGTTEGLYRTLDAGAQWERMTPADVIVNDVYIDPNDAKRVVLATERGGVYRSEDGGASFQESNEGFSARQVIAYAQDAQSTNTLYVGVVNDKATGGVFESTNGAVNWTQRSDGLGGRDVFSLLSLPGGDLLAGTAHGVFRLASGTDERWADSSILTGPLVHSTHATAVAPAARPVSTARVTRTAATVPKPGRRVNAKRLGAVPVAAKGRHASKAPVAHVKLQARSTGPRVPSRGRVNGVRRNVRVVAVNSRVHAHAVLRQEAVKKPAAPTPAAAARAGVSPKQAQDRVGKAHAARKETSGSIASTVYAMVRVSGTIFAGTGDGLVQSSDGGQQWSALTIPGLTDVHFLAAIDSDGTTSPTPDGLITLLAANLGKAAISVDGGQSWQAVPLPPGLTEIGAVGLDGEKHLWIGGREGVWFSGDGGTDWKNLKNLFLTQVDSLFYDAAGHRMLVTAANSTAAFSVEAKTQKVTYSNTGWRLRFVRPLGDHLVAGTLFDGVVLQPDMVATPVLAEKPAS